MEDKRRVSSRDVAREAGVSQATVSYILNNVKTVSIRQETRDAVMEAVRRLNYHPDEIARGMKLKRSMSIGVVTDRNVTNFYFMKTLEGIRDGIQKENYSITLLFNKAEARDEAKDAKQDGIKDSIQDGFKNAMQDAEYMRYYNSNRIDGIIFAFATIDEDTVNLMNDKGIPFIKVDPVHSEGAMYEVCTDHLDHIGEVIGYFLSKGAERIGYAGPSPEKVSDSRLEAFRQAMGSRGLKVDEGLVSTSDFNDDNMMAAVKSLLSQEKRPDAILAGSPRFGMMSVKGALSLGIKVPEELRIIALGTSNFFGVAHPAISAVELPLYDMGYKAAEMLLSRMLGGDAPRCAVLPSELVIRESC